MDKRRPPGRLVRHLRGSMGRCSAEPFPSGHLLFLVHHGAVWLEPFFSRRRRVGCLFLVGWFYSGCDTVPSCSSLSPEWGSDRVTSPCVQVLFSASRCRSARTVLPCRAEDSVPSPYVHGLFLSGGHFHVRKVCPRSAPPLEPSTTRSRSLLEPC